MISTYDTDEMCASVIRGKEVIKPVVYDYNSHMGGVKCCKHTYRNEKGSKWYSKLLKRLHSVIYNSVVIYRSLQTNKKIDPLAFRLGLIKGLIGKNRPVYLILYIGTHLLNHL
jgi:hypothetical protein